ncbi:MAG TPA: hypothetical protein VN739_01340 [Nitrososphaerales archaeon]|nr:hypothetical protein [Nitrososphaerales archaeon]
MQHRLSKDAKAASARILSEYAAKIRASESLTEDAIARIENEAIDAAFESAKTIDSSTDRKAVAQQWYGAKRWIQIRKKPEATPMQPKGGTGWTQDPSVGIPSKEATEFIRDRLREVKQNFETPARGSRTNSESIPALVLNGEPAWYVMADDEVRKSSAVPPALSEPQSNPSPVANSGTSIIRVKLPSGVELFPTVEHVLRSRFRRL